MEKLKAHRDVDALRDLREQLDPITYQLLDLEGVASLNEDVIYLCFKEALLLPGGAPTSHLDEATFRILMALQMRALREGVIDSKVQLQAQSEEIPKRGVCGTAYIIKRQRRNKMIKRGLLLTVILLTLVYCFDGLSLFSG